MNSMVEVRDVTKRFGDFVALDHVSLDIKEGEFMTFLGPSGCGKTTCLRMISGFEQPTSGQILIGGKDVSNDPPYKRNVNQVFQSYALFPHLTVRENIEFGLRMKKMSPEKIREKTDWAVAMTSLQGMEDRKPAQLSGGQRQRVALARSIVRTPRLFLMDEPLSNLDAKLRVLARAQIKHLTEELRVTTVYVTHDQIEAMTLATRVAVMHEGVIRQIGTPEEVYSDPADTFVAGFIGNPAMNLLSVEASSEGRCTVGGRPIGVAAPRPGRLVLGVRPEDLFLCTASEALLNCEVFTFELLGDSTMLTAMIDGTLLTARADKSLRLGAGDHVALGCDSSRLYWFDGDSGLRLRSQVPQKV